MGGTPDYALKNREVWTAWNTSFHEAGLKSWAKNDIEWGIWGIPEHEVGALGDLGQWRGRDVVELGCGTAYFSAWMARLGAGPVGVDITDAQLASARGFQQQFDLTFPLIRANAERVPLADACCDLVISEYGASIWCDPSLWISEAERLLRPGGSLVFLRNGTLATLCMPGSGHVRTELMRDWFGLRRLEWDDDESVEFHLVPGDMIRLLRSNGFDVEDLIDLQAPEEAPAMRFEYMTYEWARRWPSEEIWVARKR